MVTGEPAKQAIREHHLAQRRERAESEYEFVRREGRRALTWFAEGAEVCPAKIRPYLRPLSRATRDECNVFRAATLLWSIPVSRGYGRRMRYLVMDRQNDKLIGLLALGDPVFNLRCRDTWIGWNTDQRRERLAFVMDAYVLGAAPPYSSLLGGKLVGAMVASKDIQDDFRVRYGGSKGDGSPQSRKNPHSYSGYYNVRPRAVFDIQSTTPSECSQLHQTRIHQRMGHFQIGTLSFFSCVRSSIRTDIAITTTIVFGQGPNWKLRALRQACTELGVDSDLLRHGIRREVYGIPLATNWHEVLLGEDAQPTANPPRWTRLELWPSTDGYCLDPFETVPTALGRELTLGNC